LRDGLFESAHIFRTLGDAVSCEGFACIGVDIPILRGDAFPRPADIAARKRVGPARMSSVFFAPPLVVFEAGDFAEAQKVALNTIGQGLPRQTFGLAVKVREAVEFATNPNVYEVHPEVSFREMSEAPLPNAKKSWAGQRHRRRLVAEAGIELPEDLGVANVIPVDDVLDAAAAAWTANRIMDGCAMRLPDDSPDSPDAIWA
jgi:predicted RNase H-like nuclease